MVKYNTIDNINEDKTSLELTVRGAMDLTNAQCHHLFVPIAQKRHQEMMMMKAK